MKYRQASPDNPWKEYTEEHTQIRRYLFDLVGDISHQVERDPLALVGPYRTGKTQLLYEVFNEAWARGVPALYTSAGSILNEFDQRKDLDIATWLSEEVQRQVDEIQQGNSVEWLPNWDPPNKENEFFDRISDVEIEDDVNVILLVDEIEQAYTKLRQGDFVDDDNPIRVLLDDTSGVYQIWAFGLVSAYELGEADYARFDEQRLPILDVENVKTELENRGKNPDLATGIWWLSRGRIGWTNKLIDECPADDEISNWVKELSEEDFEGVTPLDNSVWTKSSVPVEERDGARKAVMFLYGEYSDWQITSDSQAAISAEKVANVSLDIIESISPVELSSNSIDLLETNLRRLTRNLVPTDSPYDIDGKYLPANLLNEKEEVEGFIDLLGDLIVSFEGSSETRADATKCLQLLDENAFRSSWADQFYQHIESENGEHLDIPAWCPKLSILKSAYPAVAVDPTQLTKKGRDSIEDRLERGIEVRPSVSVEAVEFELRFCPNDAIFETELEHVARPTNLNRVYVLFVEEEIDQDQLSEKSRKLIEHKRVIPVKWEASRLWDFVVHLNEYLETKHNLEGAITDYEISNALDKEEIRENRNTVVTLFEQLRNISETEVRDGISDFVEYYSRQGSNRPIWAEDLSGSAGPSDNPPSVYGQGSISRHALAYTLATADFDINGFESVAGVSNIIYGGTREGYILTDGNKFGFTDFVNNTLTDSGVGSALERLWQRFQLDEGVRDPSIEHFQQLMKLLSQSSFDDEDELWNQLTDMNADQTAIQIIDNTHFGNTLGSTFAWGLLLEKMAVERHLETRDNAGQLEVTIDDLQTRLEDLQDDVDNKNSKLQPPGELGRAVEIKVSGLSARKTHLMELSEKLDSLKTLCEEHESFGGIGIVYLLIISAYIDGFDRAVSAIEGTLYRSSLMGVDNLEAAYDQVSDEMENLDSIVEYVEMDESELLEQFEDQVDSMFNYVGIIGGEHIPINSEKKLEDLDSKCSDNAEELRALRKSIVGLRQAIEEQNKEMTSLKEEFASFAQIVAR